MLPTTEDAVASATTASRTRPGRDGWRHGGRWDTSAFDTSGHRSAHGAFARPVIASLAMRPLTRGPAVVILALAVAVVVAACGTISTALPAPTPADFDGIATEITKAHIAIDDLVSGDAGCSDPVLVQTAIGLTAKGLDQKTPIRMYLYIFRNRDSYEKLRSTIDACARNYVTDPDTFESIEASPFVLAGQGPWSPDFRAALRSAIEVAAGTGD